MPENPTPKHKQAATCGSWASPLSAEDVTGSTVGLGGVSVDGDTLYWLESRPTEKGRTAIVRRGPDGATEDVTPEPVNVASRVHEYGGRAYAVDKGRIVYSEKSDGSVWLVDGDKPARKVAGVEGCRYADFQFLPDSDEVVCVREDHRNRKPTDPEAAIVRLDLNAADPDTNDGAVLVKGGDFLAHPRPSPDGKKLAWLSWQHPDMPWDATQLHVADLTDTGVENAETVAGADTPESVVQPDWSPDGVLHFCSDRTDWWNIYRLEDDGTTTEVTKLTDGEIGGPMWGLGSTYYRFTDDGIIADLSRHGKSRAVRVEDDGATTDLNLPPVGHVPAPFKGGYAFVASPENALPQVVLHDGQGGETVIRTAGPQLLDDDDVSTAQEITFPTADGEDAHAFYYPPKNAKFKPKDGEKPPLIVMIHGGPTSAAGAGFSPAKQFWTSRGFAVVDVNYRGSTGYGRTYREKLNGNWGIADVEDCVAAVEYLTKKGLADPDRVAIRGGSAGGFTVLAALTTSDVFKAGASHYGVGDLMLLAGETHKFESRYLDRLLGPLPASEQMYRERSPVNNLDKMAAPAIFFQGLDDKVVPPSQAKTMVDAMRKDGLPVSHYEFAGEAHGFRMAETKKRVLDLELGFYAKIFGFTAPGLSEEPVISGLDDGDGGQGKRRVNAPGPKP